MAICNYLFAMHTTTQLLNSIFTVTSETATQTTIRIFNVIISSSFSYTLNDLTCLSSYRGATEIDVIEVMPGPPGKLPIVKNNVQRPYTSMSLQVMVLHLSFYNFYHISNI